MARQNMRLKYLCSSFSTPIMQQEVLDSGTYAVYGASGKVGYLNNFCCKEPYLGIVKDGAGVGRINQYNGETSLLGTMAYLVPNNGVNINWLKYAIMTLDLGNDVGKTTIPHIYFSDYGNRVVWYVPMEQQIQIADFLDRRCAEIDAVIERTRATIEEYKKLKQAVITEAVTKGIRGSRPMMDSGIEWIGEIPVGWLLLRITRILDYSHPYPIGDGDHGLVKTEDYGTSGIPYIRVQNVGWATPLDLSTVVYITPEINEKIKNSILRPGDVLFAKTGATIGKTAIVPDDLPISNTTSHVGKITVDPRYSAKYVFYLLSSFVGYKQFWDIACQKTTRPELSIDETKSIRVLLPSERSEQDEIVAYLDEKTFAIDTLIRKKEQYLSELDNLKKAVIYEYVTGKKEVPVCQ